MLDDAGSGANGRRKRTRMDDWPECAIQDEVALIGNEWRAASLHSQRNAGSEAAEVLRLAPPAERRLEDGGGQRRQQHAARDALSAALQRLW